MARSAFSRGFTVEDYWGGLGVRGRYDRDMFELDQLSRDIVDLARANEVLVEARIGADDGFGAKQMPTVTVSGPQVDSVVLWREDGEDFWIEVAGETATWTGHGRRYAILPEVVLALVRGDYQVGPDGITVRVADRKPFLLTSLM